MSIISINDQNVLTVHNGIAYAAIAGGAIGYVADQYKLYIGNSIHLYVAMLWSRGIETWKIVCLLAVRGAITDAAANHEAELGDLVDNHVLRVNMSETIDNAAVRALLNFNRITQADWGDNQNPPATVATFNPTHLLAALANQMKTPEMVHWASQCARLAYSIIGINGIGLITSSHHYRAQAMRAAKRTLEMYDMPATIRELGATVNEAAGFIFHDVLHYLSYEHVCTLVNANVAGFIGKVASTVLKRLPAFPGGVTFVDRAMTCRKTIRGVETLAAAWAILSARPKDAALVTLYGQIRAAPLDYNGQFRPAQLLNHQAAIDLIAPYAVVLFALYDLVVAKSNNEDNRGPTGGPGIAKMIQEHHAVYVNAQMHGRLMINAAPAVDDAGFFTQISG